MHVSSTHLCIAPFLHLSPYISIYAYLHSRTADATAHCSAADVCLLCRHMHSFPPISSSPHIGSHTDSSLFCSAAIGNTHAADRGKAPAHTCLNDARDDDYDTDCAEANTCCCCRKPFGKRLRFSALCALGAHSAALLALAA